MQNYKEEIKYLEKYIKEQNLPKEELDKYIKELEKGKPIQYIIGNVNFYGNIIKVNDSVLIPRFETELLCEKIINLVKKKYPNKKIDILDLGTGSGCIAITLKKELESNVTALDISEKALEVAKENAKLNNVEIDFINEDMVKYKEKKYDVIISNPPYIDKNEEIMDIVKDNEPHLALYAEEEGIYFYRKIIENIKYIGKEKYIIAFEIGQSQSTRIVDIAKKELTDIDISVEKDYQGLDRFIFIIKN